MFKKKKSLNILFLSRRFYPDVGGVEKHVFEISKRLVKKGHRVTVITQSQGEENELEGIQIRKINKTPDNWFKKFYIWKWFWDNRPLIKNADIIHAHDVFYWYLPFKFLFLSKKSFVTFHGYETYPIQKKAIIIRKISEYLADGNIIVGDFIRKWYGTTPNYVIYGGVEKSNLPAGKAGIKNKKSKIPKSESAVFIGRLDEHTGILDYANAVDLIRKQHPKFDFKIIGDGKYKNKLQKYKPLGFRENSIEYLRRYNFAFVSRYLSILEAFANKRLVFALYDNPVKEDYLKMSPFAKFIITENSPEMLKKKVLYFLHHPKESENLTNKGYEWAKNQTWDNVVKIYLKLWEIR